MGLLQLKSDGVTPRLMQGLGLNFETSEFYLNSLAQTAKSDALATGAAIGISSFLLNGANWQVPQGKGWLVIDAIVFGISAATEYRRGNVLATLDGNNNVNFMLTEEGATQPGIPAAAAGQLMAHLAVQKPYKILPPGTTIRWCQNQGIGAGPVNVQCGLRYIEFPW